MLDTYRQQMIQETIDSGLSYEEALIAVNRHWARINPRTMFEMKNEIWEILTSPWKLDFNNRYGPFFMPKSKKENT